MKKINLVKKILNKLNKQNKIYNIYNRYMLRSIEKLYSQ